MITQTQKPSLKKERKALVARALIEAAELVFYQKGYERATMQDIAGAAGCAAGTLYLYFKNKESLYSEIVARHTHAVVAQLDQALTGRRDPVEKLRDKTRAVLDYFNRHHAFFHIFYNGAPGGHTDIKSNLREQALQVYLAYKDREQKIIAEAQRKGLLRKDIPAGELVEFIHGTTASALARWSAGPNPQSLEEQFHLLWSFLAGGLGVHSGGER